MIDGLKVKFTGAELKEYARRHIELIREWSAADQRFHEKRFADHEERLAEWQVKYDACKTDDERRFQNIIRPQMMFTGGGFTNVFERHAQIRTLEGWLGRLIDTEEYLLGEADMIKLGAFYLEKKPEAGTAGILPADTTEVAT